MRVVVDGHPAARRGLKEILNEAGDTRVVGECGRGNEATRLVEETRLELVILSLDTAGETEGLEACRRLKAIPEAPYVLVQAAFNHTKDLLSRLLAGADSCLHKHAGWEELLDSVQRTAPGGGILRLDDGFGGEPHPSAAVGANRLTPREREVVTLVAERQTTAMIASKLRVSPQTVNESPPQRLQKARDPEPRSTLHRSPMSNYLIVSKISKRWYSGAMCSVPPEQRGGHLEWGQG